MYIKDNYDLRYTYKELISWEKEISGSRYLSTLDEIIKGLKHDIRDYFKRMDSEKAHVIKVDDEDEIVLEEIPENINTEDAAKEWFESFRYREFIPSLYDCTGQVYTSWYKIFKRRDRYIVYYCLSVDI